MVARTEADPFPFPDIVRQYLAVLADQAERDRARGYAGPGRLAAALRSMDVEQSRRFALHMARALDPHPLHGLPTSV